MLYFGMDHCDGRQNFSLIVTFGINCLFININKKFESKFEHSVFNFVSTSIEDYKKIKYTEYNSRKINTRGVERRRRVEEQLGQELFHLHQL